MYNDRPVAPKRRYGFWISEDLLAGLHFVKERDGVLESEQIRRALRAWLEQKGAIKAARPRARTRGRA